MGNSIDVFNDLAWIRSYFGSIDKNQPLSDQIDRKELEEAGFGGDYVDTLLEGETEVSVAELAKKVASAQSGPLLGVRNFILDIHTNAIRQPQFAKRGIDFSKIRLGGHIVGGKIYDSSEKLIIIYGDLHISRPAQIEIAQGLSDFVVQGLKVLGLEDSNGEYGDPVATLMVKALDKKEVIQKLVEIKFGGGEIVELLFGDQVYTTGVDDKELVGEAKLYGKFGFLEHLQENTDERSRFMTNRLLEVMEDRAAQTAGLVVGAGHIADIASLLNERQVSYLVIMPNSLYEYDLEEAASYNAQLFAEGGGKKTPEDGQQRAELPPRPVEFSDEEAKARINALLEKYRQLKIGGQYTTKYNIETSAGWIYPGSEVTVLGVEISGNRVKLRLRLDVPAPKRFWHIHTPLPTGGIDFFEREITPSNRFVFEE